MVAFLADPATHGGAPVETVTTHISRLFLAGDRAWKMKRALGTNYLDFTTLALREASCRRELEVNRAAGPLYLGVVPVVRRAGRLPLGGAGEPVEWLVEMRRFDRARELDRLCEAGTLTLPVVERLADAIAALHRAAPETPAHGDPDDVRARIAQIAGALDAAGAGAADWAAAARAACEANVPLIARRHRLGRVRRCHGDLHLGNVVLIGEDPVPFDAIEFNEAIASIDVLYDLAFALADLATRGRPDLASALLSRYLGATRDFAGLPLLPLFLSMRGAVRAMTAASRGDAAAAGRHLAFARAALAPAPPPRLLAVGGMSGTGKSTLARALAPRLAPLALVLRSDVTRKRLAGVAPETPLPPSGYTAAMDRKVLIRLAWDARIALRAGATVVLDATFLGPDWRACAAALAAAEGVPFTGLWLEISPAEAAARVGRRSADASDATPEVVARQTARAATPAGWRPVDAGQPPAAVLAAAEAALG
ncbi:AAA family ATPase [uncultured Amaricoccus sp.]|uniref:bifunctional aminoglycoside phosphotransferase/ATP-binding protein n=1 Tax=uncultured Amaricoccus sp. TaxID=339341 RepID=UPI00260E14A5|nr:AAA family ATPase [uncultured Amaricoccus sp.]